MPLRRELTLTAALDASGFVDRSGRPICRLSGQGVILDHNPAFVQCCGTLVKDPMGLHFQSLVPLEERGQLEEIFRKGLPAGKVHACAFRTNANLQLRLEWELHPLPEGEILAISEIPNPAHAKWQESDFELQNLMECSNDGILVQNGQGHILMCNSRCRELLGLSEAQVLEPQLRPKGWKFLTEHGEELPVQETPGRVAIRTGQAQQNVILGVKPPEGEPRWLLVNARPICRSGENTPWRVYSTFLDYTRIRQQQLEHMDKMNRARDLMDLVNRVAIISYVNTSGAITQVNDNFCRVTGYTPDEIIGRPYSVLKSGVHPPEFFVDLWRTVSGGKIWKGTVCNRKKDGHYYWVDSVIAPQKDAKGGVKGYVTIRYDVTEAHERLERLQRLGAIIEASPDCIGFANAKGVSEYKNASWRRKLPPNKNPLEPIESFHPAWASQLIVNQAIPICQKKGMWQGETAILEDKDGQLIECPVLQTIIAHRSQAGEINYYSTIIRDISAQKRYEKALDEQRVQLAIAKTRLETAMDAGAFGVWEIEVFSQKVHLNARMKEILEWDEDAEGPELHVQDVLKRILSSELQEEVMADLEAAMTYNRNFEKEMTIQSLKGRDKVVRTLGKGIYDEMAQMTSLVGVAWDITEQKLQEKKLIEASKMSSLGEMSAGMAHEINNPLAIISGKAQQLMSLAEAGLATPELTRKFAENIDKTALRITKIVKGLRSFARNAEADPFEMCKVSVLLEETLSLCQARFLNHGVSLRFDNQAGESEVECRPTQIIQVLLNLLNNAFDAVSEYTEKWVSVTAVATSSVAEFRIVDSGHGIPTDMRDKILQPFFTTKGVGKGTGLGLSIVTGILKSHQGVLEIDPHAQNTTFIVRLPVHRASEEWSAA